MVKRKKRRPPKFRFVLIQLVEWSRNDGKTRGLCLLTGGNDMAELSLHSKDDGLKVIETFHCRFTSEQLRKAERCHAMTPRELYDFWPKDIEQ